MASQPAISVVGLTKRYKDVVAVDDISFDIAAGSVFAFLGTNGAGKSTTISCVTTVSPFDSGEIAVEGHSVRHDPEPIRRQIGVVFQDSMLDAQLTPRENLMTRARFYTADRREIGDRITELAALIGLEGFLDRRYGKLSGGQRRRVDIARALVHSPSILFLDEPTAGLDPASRALVWSTIHDLRDRHGLTVFLTTHYMEETEEADLVSIIDEGRIIALGTPTELRAKHSHSILTVSSRDLPGLRRLAEAAGVELTGHGDTAELRVRDAALARQLLADHGDDVLDFEFRHGRMDDVFLALTGRERVEEAS